MPEPGTEREVLDAFADMERNEATSCAYVGHEWGDAGGGLLICVVCTAEKWSERTSCQMCGAHADDPCDCFDIEDGPDA